MPAPFRLVAWNIRAGGGKRAAFIGEVLVHMSPDIVVLSEFRSGRPSQEIAGLLAGTGLSFQVSALKEVKTNANTVMIASRAPLARIGLRKAPDEPGRWAMVREGAHGIAIGAMHIPIKQTGRKNSYHDSVVDLAKRWKNRPTLLVGDTNSGRIGIDEETPVFNKRTDAWFERLERAGWRDGFRALHGDRREYTWYSHRENGFRLDQVFVSPLLGPHLRAVSHVWPPHPLDPARRDGLSDHAALIADFEI